MFNLANNIGQNPNPDKGCMDYVKEYWASVPFYNRLLLVVLPTIYGLCWLYPLQKYSMNMISLTVYRKEFWRIFIAPYVHFRLLTLFFVLISYIPTGCIREKAIGTVKIILNFMIMNMIIQILFLGISYVILNFIKPNVFFISVGIWPVIIAEIVIDYNRMPDHERRFCCCPFALKSKYHPWIYVILFSIMNPVGAPAMISGFIVGYLYVFKILTCLDISNETARCLENSFLFSFFASNFDCFVKLQNAEEAYIYGEDGRGRGNGMPNYIRQQNDNGRGSDVQTPSGNTQSNTHKRGFPGQGVRLGGEEVV
ncbi:unnamed protein product [Moneuplotes crassus]|uniref:Peptidase S54 rhomboid domain-containing protein n=1 Tax=Euplotes crassus TaxID=5936 RepID=A0AAD1XM61_EUPCR|nr:unnamed protein product [Moneuplotes crassus]